MKRKLFLHIGQPKSATTSIQAFLRNNRQALLAQGVLYPMSGLQYLAHHCLGNFFADGPVDWITPLDPEVVMADLETEISETGCQTIIMSTESLFYPSVDPLKVRQYFGQFDVSICMTLRRQDEWLESALRDNIKTGHVNGNDHMARVRTLFPSVDYESKIAKWAAVFGTKNILLSTFEPGVGREPVENNFLEIVGAVFSPEMKIEPTRNDRLSRDCLAFLSLLKSRRRISAKYFTYFDILADYSKQNKDPEEYRYILPPEMRQKILADNAEANARIARQFFDREDGILFRQDPSAETVPWAEYPGLTRAKAVKIGEYLADRLYVMLQHQHEKQRRH